MSAGLWPALTFAGVPAGTSERMKESKSMKSKSVQELIGESRTAIQDALSRADLVKAWDCLQERDAEGIAKGPLPYTDEAITFLHKAFANDPDDVGVVHHLAIAHHARAWDLELKGDPNASREWETALGFWRTIASSAEFWNGLEAKLQADADVSILSELRRDLLEQLLDIHVDFVRHYCEGNTPDRATAHVEIVKRAKIPPAIKARLIEKVFDAMTGAVPEARASGACESALDIVERFLKLFPDYLRALRMHMEISRDWLSGMSYKDNWNEIVRLGNRALPYASIQVSHTDLESEPLAKTALDDLAFEMCLRGRDRGNSFLAAQGNAPMKIKDREDACQALEFAMQWGRTAYPKSPSGSYLRQVLADSLSMHTSLLFQEALELQNSGTDVRTEIAAQLNLLRSAQSEVEEALQCVPGDNGLQKNLEILEQNIAALETKQRMIDLLKGFGDLP